MVPQEEAVITASQAGYIKRLPPTAFRIQKRGGKGTIGLELKEEDFVSHFVSANTHDNILFFTDRGRVFQTKVYEIPVGNRTSKGKLVQNFLEIPAGESINAILAYRDGNEKDAESYIVMVTKNGLVKKTSLSDFKNVRRSGIIAITLKDDDRLRGVKLSSGKDEAILVSSLGIAIKFKETNIRAMGRTASGVRGIRLGKGDSLVSLDIIQASVKSQASGSKLLVVMSNGFGKQTNLKEYKTQSRGGKGIKTAKVTAKTGEIISARIVNEEEELIALSTKGQVIRTNLKDVRTAGRATQGVKIMNVEKGDKLIGIACL